ncbi:D-hexose-6-phosphate mutarotase [Thiosulfatimonas sediminis]|uniref:Putative glucose-6-phosphate 1-epimerase n=1 Tax=Thiosulfatimonas sediminis TaxID=2675054 RepID=A0A6F8PY57_9GAMM|nr:D-hexose-6-phosphate mutarotase [Thiosulfatimonas sediminis]BBP47082.1 D-hexose-6-phosphate mutarotase [Thiosulfatimonas sediminis]
MTEWNHIKGLRFSMCGDVPMIEVDNDYATARMTTHGATVLSYCPKDSKGKAGEDLIWVSDNAIYDNKTPVRGGVPICWPWFGAYKAEFNSPLEDGAEPQGHGLVRKKSWHLARIETLKNGATLVEFTTQADAETRAIWPYEFLLSLQVVVGETLGLTLTTSNLNPIPLKITEALHTYFKLPINAKLLVDGLQGAEEIDTLKDNQSRDVTEKLLVKPPMDSVYLQVQPTLTVSAGGKPALQIEASNAASSVLWNPGPETVKGFKDIHPDHWTQFVCIENGNIWDDAVTIAPEGKHRLQIAISKP